MNGNNKYVYLSASSHFKGQMDREKYEKARRLKKMIPQIRGTYEIKGKSVLSTSPRKHKLTQGWQLNRRNERTIGSG